VKKVLQHLLSLMTAMVITVNLTFWMFLLVILGLVKALVRHERFRHLLTYWVESFYRGAAGVDNFWMLHIVGVRLNIHGELPDHAAPIIISNHQSWMDIPVLHGAITRHNGPILKFLIKRELLWVPVIGWICYALGFPALRRGQGDNAREQDYAAIQNFSSSLTRERGALLIFAEGTRFTAEKHHNQNSPYNHLLTPRPGGLKIALETTPPGTPIVDLTISYRGVADFWQCLGGATKDIDVWIRTYPDEDIQHPRDWLEQRWKEKDSFLSS
jgi:1-acyl-sn-glycerol-3-phosphate acyltransferase